MIHKHDAFSKMLNCSFKNIHVLLSIHKDSVYPLIGPFSCVCSDVFALWHLAANDSGPGRVLHLQHGGTRSAELTETSLEILIQVAIKNRVQATAGEENKITV